MRQSTDHSETRVRNLKRSIKGERLRKDESDQPRETEIRDRNMSETKVTQKVISSLHLKRSFCLDARTASFTAAVYCMCSSILVVLIYGWRISLTAHNSHALADVYYGVQVSYVATLISHLMLICASAILILGVVKEEEGLVGTWVVGVISLMAIEGVCCVYSNVLRDHINKEFDKFSKAELFFYLSRILLNVFALIGVLNFHRKLREGFSYKEPEAIEL